VTPRRARRRRSGPVITVDALNTQKSIAARIVDAGGEYVMPLPFDVAQVEAYATDQIEWLTDEQRAEWAGPRSVAVGPLRLRSVRCLDVGFREGP